MLQTEKKSVPICTAILGFILDLSDLFLKSSIYSGESFLHLVSFMFNVLAAAQVQFTNTEALKRKLFKSPVTRVDVEQPRQR